MLFLVMIRSGKVIACIFMYATLNFFSVLGNITHTTFKKHDGDKGSQQE